MTDEEGASATAVQLRRRARAARTLSIVAVLLVAGGSAIVFSLAR
ncbi:MAG: hypothetical protein ACKOXM_00905 [Agromyces sp.]